MEATSAVLRSILPRQNFKKSEVLRQLVAPNRKRQVSTDYEHRKQWENGTLWVVT